MLAATLPVIAVVAARTGAGKSTVSRYLMAALKSAGRSPVAIRHPMPYGDLTPRVERYACVQDVCDAKISIEAMEEYQQHVAEGFVVFAGVDYVKVLQAAEAEADAIVWDGGNNDMPFLRPDVTVTVLDPVRPNQGAHYFPGEVNIRAADILLVNKVNVAQEDAVEACIDEARRLNPKARVLRMQSVADVDHAELVRARRVLAVDDGPSLTHGGLSEGVAGRAARSLGAELVDPRRFAVGSVARAFDDYPHIGCVLPALGYGAVQLEELARTIERTPCDAVLLGTPAPLERLFPIPAPVAHARFYARDVEGSSLAAAVLGLAGIGRGVTGR